MVTSTRINLLSTPRNVSTALMYSFSQRDDVYALDEPFYARWLLATGVKHPGRKEVLENQEPNSKIIIKQLRKKNWEKPILFVKNMCPQLAGLPFDFLSDFKNIIFIRNPRQAVASYAKVFEPNADEMGTLIQLKIFNFLKKQGQTPLVLDSAHLLQNPPSVLTELCHRLDIPFDRAMLQWETGPKKVDGIWAKYWYSNAHKSTGFKQKQAKTILPNLPKYLERLCNQLVPAYEELAQYSIW